MIGQRRVTGVMACDDSGTIGNSRTGHGLPLWDCPRDLENFRKLTDGHCVIMGRVSYDLFPARLFDNRTAIVLSRKAAPAPAGGKIKFATDFSGLAELVAATAKEQEIFLIGGANTSAQFFNRNLIDSFVLTRIDGTYEGDCRFSPEFLKGVESWRKHASSREQNFTTTTYHNPLSPVHTGHACRLEP